jgi:hypothetical protein
MNYLRLAIVAALAMLVTSTAHAANIYTRARPWGGSYIFIVGEIHPGDEIAFAHLDPPPPVYVRPIGPGGVVPTALATDLIHERHYNTVVQNNDTDGSGFRGCLSACTAIWLSGWHVLVQNSAILGFHSCYNRDENGHAKDNLGCDAEIADHLQKYGYTAYQAWVLANASPNEIMRLGTKA